MRSTNGRLEGLIAGELGLQEQKRKGLDWKDEKLNLKDVNPTATTCIEMCLI